MQELTDEQCQKQYAKLKKIDEYAKSLGIILDNVQCRLLMNNKEYSIDTPIFGNKSINIKDI